MAETKRNGFEIARQAGTGRSGLTVETFKRSLVDNLYYSRGQGAYTAGAYDIYMALAYTVRDALMDRWRKTVDRYVVTKPKFVYYLSAEYLPGRPPPGRPGRSAGQPCAPLAQSAERLHGKEKVYGSIP